MEGRLRLPASCSLNLHLGFVFSSRVHSWKCKNSRTEPLNWSHFDPVSAIEEGDSSSRRTASHFPPSTVYPNFSFSSEGSPKGYDRTGRDGGGGSARTTSIHVTALDGLVNVNSLFTIAVFVGLSIAAPGQRSLEGKSACDAGPQVAENLLVFEVVSFSSFLFSSLVAQGLKLAINLLNSKDVDEAFRAHINIKVLRFGMLLSAGGSVLGCIFLMLSMVNVIQIRLGMLSCGSKAAVRAVTTLVSLVSSALVLYISTVLYSFKQ